MRSRFRHADDVANGGFSVTDQAEHADDVANGGFSITDQAEHADDVANDGFSSITDQAALPAAVARGVASAFRM